MRASTGIAAGLAAVAGLVALAVWHDDVEAPAGAPVTATASTATTAGPSDVASPTTVPPFVTASTVCLPQAALPPPSAAADTVPVVTDTIDPADLAPPTFDAGVVEAAVRVDPHVVEAIGTDFTVMSAIGMPGGVISVTVKTAAPVVVPRTPYTWAWAVDEYGAPIVDCGDPAVRPPLQYFRLALLAPDFRLREIIPVLGETVEPGIAPTRPAPSTTPPVTLVSPEQIAAAEAALRADQSILDVIGTDFTVIRGIPAKFDADDVYGVALELKLSEPRTLPVGVPVLIGHGEGQPPELGPLPYPIDGVHYVDVMLHPDGTLWWYQRIPDELGEHYEDEAASTTSVG